MAASLLRPACLLKSITTSTLCACQRSSTPLCPMLASEPCSCTWRSSSSSSITDSNQFRQPLTLIAASHTLFAKQLNVKLDMSSMSHSGADKPLMNLIFSGWQVLLLVQSRFDSCYPLQRCHATAVSILVSHQSNVNEHSSGHVKTMMWIGLPGLEDQGDQQVSTPFVLQQYYICQPCITHIGYLGLHTAVY